MSIYNHQFWTPRSLGLEVFFPSLNLTPYLFSRFIFIDFFVSLSLNSCHIVSSL